MSRDIVNSIKATLYDRVSSPVYGTFIFVWLLSNWKVVYITLFADDNYLKMSRLDWIVAYFSKGLNVFGWFELSSFFTNAFLFPLVYTAIILLWLPKLLKKIDKIILNHKKERKEQQQEIEKEILLSVADSTALRTKHSDLEENFKAEIDKYSEKEQDLKINVKNLEEILKQSRDEGEKLKKLNKSIKEEHRKKSDYINTMDSNSNLMLDDINMMRDYIRAVRKDSKLTKIEMGPNLLKIIDEKPIVNNNEYSTKKINSIGEIANRTGGKGNITKRTPPPGLTNGK